MCSLSVSKIFISVWAEVTHFFLFPLASSLDGLSRWVLYTVLKVKIPGLYHFSLATVVGNSMLFPSVFLVIWAGILYKFYNSQWAYTPKLWLTNLWLQSNFHFFCSIGQDYSSSHSDSDSQASFPTQELLLLSSSPHFRICSVARIHPFLTVPIISARIHFFGSPLQQPFQISNFPWEKQVGRHFRGVQRKKDHAICVDILEDKVVLG